MDTSYLRSVVQSDISSSLTPVAICATAGTTNTGAVDDIAACRAIADEFDTWLHVDAAYGGAFAITETGEPTVRSERDEMETSRIYFCCEPLCCSG